MKYTLVIFWSLVFGLDAFQNSELARQLNGRCKAKRVWEKGPKLNLSPSGEGGNNLHPPLSQEGSLAHDGTTTTTHGLVSSSPAYPMSVMLFIDGTWLYYSFYGRHDRCEITKRYGPNWSRIYDVRWERLPSIVARELQNQLRAQSGTDRFVEVTRTVVYSSMRSDTEDYSLRARMFRKMQECSNFEVHLMTTEGDKEKCVDIACAVDMLNYATVPGAYDTAAMVTGDKDFAPALVRTRGKGRRVAIVSMRNSCNSFLMDPASHVRDFDILWLDNYLGELLEKRYHAPALYYVGNEGIEGMQVVPELDNLLEDIIELIAEEPGQKMSSRLLGRELQGKITNGKSHLTKIKMNFGSVRNFLLSQPEIFKLAHSDDPSERKEFYVSLAAGIDAAASDEEEEEGGGPGRGRGRGRGVAGAVDVEVVDPTEETLAKVRQRLAGLKVAELREQLRARALNEKGLKAALVERLAPALAQEMETKMAMEAKMREVAARPRPSRQREVAPATEMTAESQYAGEVFKDKDPSLGKKLVEVIADGIHQSNSIDKTCSSRDVGRFLSQQPAIRSSEQNALQELKENYKSLRYFLQCYPEVFRFVTIPDQQVWEFGVQLREREEGETEGESSETNDTILASE